ncbi:unnamed protein product [Pleuronectes platessa]|uniref:Uncharacterized protein n=1 Tax=Pleuronectes platessa TaxID=8262 RepID=A0A9N7V1K8_PLEPL|nr:unnamed protein product [Pleuronectes platessa]
METNRGSEKRRRGRIERASGERAVLSRQWGKRGPENELWNGAPVVMEGFGQQMVLWADVHGLGVVRDKSVGRLLFRRMWSNELQVRISVLEEPDVARQTATESEVDTEKPEPRGRVVSDFTAIIRVQLLQQPQQQQQQQEGPDKRIMARQGELTETR